MRKISVSIAVFCLSVLFICTGNLFADTFGIDVSPYLGRTVKEVLADFPELTLDRDDNGSGRDFLGNGEVAFYFDYVFTSNNSTDLEEIQDARINRIVFYGYCGADYRIDKLPGGATYADEYIYLTDMGYSLLFKTDDMRNFWKDDSGHLIIVTRGQFAGSCETDYSLIVGDEYWE